MIQRLSILVTVAVFTIAASRGSADAQSCPAAWCDGTYADISSTSASGNLTAPSNCDACPGHCADDAAVPCIVNSTCGGNVCSFSGNYGHCTNPGKLGRACSNDGNCYISPSEPGACANYSTPYAGDGLCTIYYTNYTTTAYTINGWSGDDLICVSSSGAGNMTVNGNAGNDTVLATHTSGTYTINGGDGSDYLSGGDGVDTINGDGGDNFILGNGGADTLIGGSGDDVILGGDGNDTIIGQGGRDTLNGEAGNDTIFTTYFITPANDVLGSILCGGPGNDVLVGNGPGHQCMDPGDDQAPTTAAPYDCTYANTPDDTDASDVGTARNCKNTHKTSTNGTLSTRVAGCGCD